jgi:hypothetical protein
VHADFAVLQKQTIMLMGTAEKLAEPPTEKVQFIEDMPEQDKRSAQVPPASTAAPSLKWAA